jgi:WD40 repeat protein
MGGAHPRLLERKEVRTIHPLDGDIGGTSSLAFAPNGTLATGTYAGVIQLWNPSTGNPSSHPVLAAAVPVASIGFDPTGQRFATAGGPEGGLKLWFTSSLQQDGATLDPEQRTWGDAQFTPNGQFLLAVNANGQGSLRPISLGPGEPRVRGRRPQPHTRGMVPVRHRLQVQPSVPLRHAACPQVSIS